MLARKTIRLAQLGIRLLEQQGEGEKARAIAEVLDAATGTAAAGDQYLTTGQVARALGVTTQTIHNWIRDGRLPAARLGGRTVVHRDSVLRTLEELEKARPKPPSQTKPDPARAAERYRFILSQLPPDKLARLEALHAKLEAGERLLRGERTEMQRLETELLELAGKSLDDRTAGCAPA
jgi:excisionase family DNA binding protein